MDIAWAHILQHKIMKQSEERENSRREGNVILEKNLASTKQTCPKCGQNPYFCQCKNIEIKLKINKK